MSCGGLIFAAPASGEGKTLLVAALIRVLCRRGHRVVAAKTGPDYIDPGFHRTAGAHRVDNLDGWAMSAPTLAGIVADLTHAGDIVICEGAMGLFDGALLPPTDTTQADGSTAHCAAITGWPVILIVNAAGRGASAAAVVRGCVTAREDMHVAGVVFNRVSGPGHVQALIRGMRLYAPDIPLLGCFPHAPDLSLPRRHLGLVQADDISGVEALLDRAADLVARHIDITAVLDQARPAQQSQSGVSPSLGLAHRPPLGQKIALARDSAFSFVYRSLLDRWRRAGAEIVFFSPLADDAPPKDADAIMLPGGYPELYAGQLAANRCFMDGLRGAAAQGHVIYGECGGFMTLGRCLIDAQGKHHVMAGLLPLDVRFDTTRRTLGYRQLTLCKTTALGPGGCKLRGHEFHYTQIVGQEGDSLFDACDAAGRSLPAMGLCQGRVYGSFAHIIDYAG